MERILAQRIADLPQDPSEGVREVQTVEGNHLAEAESSGWARMDRLISRHDLRHIPVPFDLSRIENALYTFPDALPIIL